MSTLQQTKKQSNFLIKEKSPYLLQHAHNPVDWFPWGDEAFEKARHEDKPIFLSIGYSTCHWCHVMERESFEDEEVAEILNNHFISIKVDREERPDIDTIYMSVCQAMTGHGGWPLTIVMTPEKKPFFSGTYFPKRSARGMPGLMDILNQIEQLWTSDKETLLTSSEKITEAIQDFSSNQSKGEVSKELLHQAFKHFEKSFDSQYGGFGSAPKFPTPHNLSFLLRYWKMTDNNIALQMVEKTLDSMYQGGIYDHIGYGFTRYSTDREWLVPHFEKMLYDNALLAIAYVEGYQATGKEIYVKVAKEIFRYVLRDMTSPDGGFFSAEDADSEGEEGKFYVWTQEEIKEVLGESLGRHFCQDFDITPQGNFEGKSIPNLIKTGLLEGYDEAREKLFQYREKRIHPFKDDKILTSWNGLMIAALAYGGRILEEPSYIAVAESTVEFIQKSLRREDGRLMARFRDGEVAYLAYLDDYAFLTWGLIELYQSTFKQEHLDLAMELTNDMVKYFWDEENSGFYLYGSDAEALISRPKEVYDGATPSGNSVATVNLLRLYRLTEDEQLGQLAQAQLQAFGGTINEVPSGYSHFLMAVFLDAEPPLEVSISGGLKAESAKGMLQLVNKEFRPNMLLKAKPSEDIKGETTVHVCSNFACHPPVTNIDELEKILKN